MSIKQMAKVWEWSKAESTSLLLMLALADHADDDGFCYPGVTRLAQKCRISPRSVQRHLKELEDMGELLVSLNKGVTVQGGATNRYRITVQRGDILTGGDKPGMEGVTNEARRGDTTLSPKPSGEPSGEPSALTIIEFPLTPKGEGVITSFETKRDLSQGFDEFWRDYPKKISKQSALKAWKRHRCVDKMEEILFALILQKSWQSWTKKNGQFIPYPASWLNAHGWENEEPILGEKQEQKKKGF